MTKIIKYKYEHRPDYTEKQHLVKKVKLVETIVYRSRVRENAEEKVDYFNKRLDRK